MSDLRPLGILTAIPEEMADLVDREKVHEKRAGLTFLRGMVSGRDAILVEAGMGKVNAALAATLLLDRYGCRALLFCGVAGGVDPALSIGDIVVGRRNLQHDYGAITAGELITYQPGRPPLPGRDTTHGYDMEPDLLARLQQASRDLALPAIDAAVTGAATRVPRIVFGTVASGDTFINCERTRTRLAASFGAQAVEMEGGAVAQVCERLGGVPFVNVRCLSDLAGGESHLDFGTFLPVAARIASAVVHRLAPEI